MCSILGLSSAAFAATVDGVNEDNLAVPPVDGKTLVYTDAEGAATFGWFDPVNDSGVIGRGLEVNNEGFSGKKGDITYPFDGCIMAQPDLDVNCQAPGDSGKRFKLKTTETNGPIDLVFNVSPDDAEKLYRVIGKFSNLTDVTNSVTGDLKAFKFETGFGAGNAFTASSAEIDGEAVPIAAFDTWATNPPKILNTSDDSLYATWISDEGEDGMYELAGGSFETLEAVNAMILADPAVYERVAGYVQGPVEDLANVNINTTISVADTSSWPTCTSDGVDTNCTFTLRVTGLNDVVDVPEIPITPVEEEPTDH